MHHNQKLLITFAVLLYAVIALVRQIEGATKRSHSPFLKPNLFTIFPYIEQAGTFCICI
jgi:hypothetical protein